MGFSGENQTVGTTAHLHTNTAGDGGSLDDTTLLNTTHSLRDIIVAL